MHCLDGLLPGLHINAGSGTDSGSNRRSGWPSCPTGHLRDTGEILAEAARLPDFSKPVAVMLISILHLVPDEDDPHAIVTRLMEAPPSGSWLALSHAACDIPTQQMTEAASRFNQLSPAQVNLRTRAESLRFVDGLELLPPGLGPGPRRRP